MTSTVESVTVEIDAPATFVWQVLIDYPNYPQWNPYTLAVDTTLKLDAPINLTLPRPDGREGTFVSREFIRAVEPPRLLRYDTGDTFPGLLGVREQHITPLDENRCSYRTFETFTGEYADAVMSAQGAWVKKGFDAVAHALRDRVTLLLRLGSA